MGIIVDLQIFQFEYSTINACTAWLLARASFKIPKTPETSEKRERLSFEG